MRRNAFTEPQTTRETRLSTDGSRREPRYQHAPVLPPVGSLAPHAQTLCAAPAQKSAGASAHASRPAVIASRCALRCRIEPVESGGQFGADDGQENGLHLFLYLESARDPPD